MILCDWQISRAVEDGEIDIWPWDDKMLQPASVDVRLSNRFRHFRSCESIDPTKISSDLTYEKVVEDGQYLTLLPGQFVLGCTLERVKLTRTFAARIEGKSSIARLGVIVHSTAGFVDPGFYGQLTLEISNLNSSPVLLRPSMRVAQLSFMKILEPNFSYGDPELGSHYQGQRGPTPSRIHEK